MVKDSPFNILAETYDADFTQTQIGKLQRSRVWKFLLPVLNSYNRPLKILEINCGTGEDALQLVKMGHKVIATDASEKMIEKACEKLYTSNVKSIQFVQCSFSELKEHFANEKFDFVFSNFGGINCINKSELVKLSKTLSEIIAAKGFLFLTIMSRFCLWEILYYSLKGNFSTAFRRLKKSASFRVNGSSMPVFYYSPGDLKKIFEPLFIHCQTYPVGLFIPPSYLEKHFAKRSDWLSRLNVLEQCFGSSLFSPLADHFCIIFKRERG